MKKPVLILIFGILLFISACSVPHGAVTPTPTETPEPTETPIPEPTPTIPPSAAMVNGFYIAIEDLDCKMQQLRDAAAELGEESPSDDELREEALQDLIEETLFLAAARKNGISLTEADLDAQIESLCSSLGGCDKLRSWESENHYSEAGFRRALERETAAAAMREIIFSSLKDIEQIHVYRIWSERRSDLDEVMNRLNMGISFIELAKNYDAVTGGDMSWFPRGILFSQDLEDKLFGLNTGEHTEILETEGVYNIFYVADKQTGRGMDTQVEQLAQRKALSEWLENQKSQAVIEIL